VNSLVTSALSSYVGVGKLLPLLGSPALEFRQSPADHATMFTLIKTANYAVCASAADIAVRK
jgi:hypothetical protein